MSLESTLGELFRCLEQWREAMEHLQLTVREDCPEELAFADSFNDAISDQLGWLGEARECAQAAGPELARDGDLGKVQARLGKVQQLVNEAVLNQAEHLTGCEQLRLLTDLREREQARPWRDWVQTVEASLVAFPRLLHVVLEAERKCWEALCELLRHQTVSVRNVSVGQQFFRENESSGGLAEAAGAVAKFWATEPQTDD